MTEDINNPDDPDEELTAEVNRQLLDLLAHDPRAIDDLIARTPGDLHLWLQDTPLTESQADELRSFIMSLKPRACLVQPDVVDVFSVDDEMEERIIAKLREFGVERVLPFAPGPKERPE